MGSNLHHRVGKAEQIMRILQKNVPYLKIPSRPRLTRHVSTTPRLAAAERTGWALTRRQDPVGKGHCQQQKHIHGSPHA